MSRHKSGPLREAEAKAQEIEGAVSAYDFHGDEYVRVLTDEGCDFILASAFVLKFGEWYLVFAEHHDPHVFHEDDVVTIYQYRIKQHQHEIQDVAAFVPTIPG